MSLQVGRAEGVFVFFPWLVSLTVEAHRQETGFQLSPWFVYVSRHGNKDKLMTASLFTEVVFWMSELNFVMVKGF